MSDELSLAVEDLRRTGMDVVDEFPLAARTTYAVGGRARAAVSITNETDAILVAGVLSQHREVSVLVVGRGSNMLVADDGFDGIAILVDAESDADGIDIEEAGDGGFVVNASSHVLLPVLARRSVAAGCCGLEWAVGVPGTVGGGVRMNAGGHGSDFAESLLSARVLSLKSGNVVDVDAEDLGLHFRGSALSPWHVVLSARLRASVPHHDNCSQVMSDIVAWRREHQPGGRNAGSVFVNPGPGENSSGALIDRCGLTGLRHGSAEVSTKHANFIQADQDGTAADVISLMSHVQDAVREQTGITLRSEVQLVGFDTATADRFAGSQHHDESVSRKRDALAAMMGDPHE